MTTDDQILIGNTGDTPLLTLLNGELRTIPPRGTVSIGPPYEVGWLPPSRPAPSATPAEQADETARIQHVLASV
jgi:hypothetical protein